MMKICSYEWWDEGRAGEFGAHASDGQVPGSLFRNGRRCQMQTVKEREGENRGRSLPFAVARQALHVLQCKFALL